MDLQHSPNEYMQDGYKDMRDLKWSAAEKVVARKAFERAIHGEFEAVMAEAKRRAAKIRQPNELWELDAISQSVANRSTGSTITHTRSSSQYSET